MSAIEQAGLQTVKGQLVPWYGRRQGVSVGGVAPAISQRAVGFGGPRLHWGYLC